MIALLDTLYRGSTRWRYRLLLTGIVLVGAVEGMTFALLVPVLSSLFLADFNRMWLWGGVLAATATGYALLLVAVSHLGSVLGTETLRILYRRLGDHLAALPLGWFQTERTGPLGRLVSKGAIDIAGVPRHLLRPVIGAIVAPLTMAILMLFLDWRIGMALVAAAPILFAFTRIINRVVAKADVSADAAAAEANGRVVEFARNQPVLRAFGRNVDGNRLLDDAMAGETAAVRRMLIHGAFSFEVFLVVLQTVLGIVVVMSIFLMLDGDLSVASGIALLVLSVRFVEPFANAADLGASIRLAAESLRRLNAILNTPPLPEPETPQAAEGAGILFDAVTFGYAPDDPVLKNVEFAVPERSMTALVGHSGSGKTTLVHLIARFFDVQSGAIRVGGHDVRDLGTEKLMGQISMVFQDVYLFEGTVMDNIRVGRRDASDAEVLEAARQARVDEIVERLPQGWDTQVGEGGTALSGGERQRLSIARALLKDAPIILLDEATASLDPENEAAIQQAVKELARNRTVVVIAHRLNTVESADQIVVLEKGRVAERGRHADLLVGNDGPYARFWAQRTRAAGWRLAG